MPRALFDFRTWWRVPGTVAEVAEVMFDPGGVSAWCPAVYRRSVVLEPGDERGLGLLGEFRTASWVGYRLTFRLRVTEVADNRCAFTAHGDLAGRGEWRLVQHGTDVEMFVHWHVGIEQPLLRPFAALLRPALVANHDWAMETTRRSLLLELGRRRTPDPADRAALPAPPGRPRLPVVIAGIVTAGAFAARWASNTRPGR